MAMLTACSRPVLVLAGHTRVHATAAVGYTLQFSVPMVIEEPHELRILEQGTEAERLLVTRMARVHRRVSHGLGRSRPGE
jgi:hypothetical protein